MAIWAGPLLIDSLRRCNRPLQVDRHLTIQWLARERWHADTGIHAGVARTHIWLFVQRGTLLLHTAGTRQEVHTGQAAAVPQHAPYQFWVAPEQHCEHVILNATGSHCNQWWRFLGHEQPLVLDLHRQREIEQHTGLNPRDWRRQFGTRS